MGEAVKSRSESLFQAEAGLRQAAREYAHAQGDQTRKNLRAAAMAYASWVNAIDEDDERPST